MKKITITLTDEQVAAITEGFQANPLDQFRASQGLPELPIEDKITDMILKRVINPFITEGARRQSLSGSSAFDPTPLLIPTKESIADAKKEGK